MEKPIDPKPKIDQREALEEYITLLMQLDLKFKSIYEKALFEEKRPEHQKAFISEILNSPMNQKTIRSIFVAHTITSIKFLSEIDELKNYLVDLKKQFNKLEESHRDVLEYLERNFNCPLCYNVEEE
ncbi:MAG: hypothetical protein ACYDIC_14310 [Desulfobaccales bacterium]